MRLIIELSERDKEKLLTPVAGSGGFQSLLRNLQHGIHGNELVLTVDQIKHVIDYVKKYGSGGFQSRMEGIIEEINSLLNALGIDPI